MAANLANIYASMLRKYGDNYMITYGGPATYLSKIAGIDPSEKVLFLYEEDQNKARTLNFVSPSKLNIKKSPKCETDLDLTGSPLKDDCIVDAIDDMSLNLKLITLNPWPIHEELHKGIVVEKARSIICAESAGNQSNDTQGSLWVLCNGADAEKTLLLQSEFAKGYFSRGIITFMGMLPANAVNVQTLLRQHYALIRAGTQLDTIIENTYNMTSQIALRCTWTTSAAAPTLIDLSTCDVTLSQTFRLSECGPLTEDFMNQLRILMYIRDDILIYRKADAENMARDVVYRCGRGIDMEELRVSIKKVLTEISGFAEIETGSETVDDIEAVVQRAKIRRLTDLTDKLWDILKCCSSYKDLKNAFNILFQHAARCNIVNTPINKNRLAEIITEVANRRLAIPCLTGTEPLELLLEIGMEKLYKDYEHIFTESKICNANMLLNKTSTANANAAKMPTVRKSLHNAIQPEVTTNRKTLLLNDIKGAGSHQYVDDDMTGFKNSHFDERESAAGLARLWQIHCTLEHLLLIHINLNLSSGMNASVCEQLLKKPTRMIDVIDDALTDEIEITLSAHDVRKHLEDKDPYIRRITMQSKNKFRNVKSTFFYSMENVCPPGIAECFNADGKEIAKENLYYAWLYRKIQTTH